jgi:hypothetical protein
MKQEIDMCRNRLRNILTFGPTLLSDFISVTIERACIVMTWYNLH